MIIPDWFPVAMFSQFNDFVGLPFHDPLPAPSPNANTPVPTLSMNSLDPTEVQADQSSPNVDADSEAEVAARDRRTQTQVAVEFLRRRLNTMPVGSYIHLRIRKSRSAHNIHSRGTLNTTLHSGRSSSGEFMIRQTHNSKLPLSRFVGKGLITTVGQLVLRRRNLSVSG
jgi:hypothetical protein